MEQHPTERMRMALESPEAMLISISKDVERLASTVHENAVLFRENQQSLNTLLGEMREHKAVDEMIHKEFQSMQHHVYGTAAEVGLVTHIHDLKGKVGSIWKVLWSFIGALATGAAGYFLANFKL